MRLSLNQVPLIRLIIPLILGIVSCIFIQYHNTLSFYLLGFVFGIYLIAFFIERISSNYKYRWLLGSLVYLNLFLAGYCLTSIKVESSKQHYIPNTHNGFIIGEIIETPKEKENTFKVILNVKGLKTEGKWQANNSKVLAYIQKDKHVTQLGIGDIISFQSTTKDVSPPKNPYEFDYRRYLSFHAIYQQTYIPSNKWLLIQKEKDFNLYRIADDIRKNLIKSLNEKGVQSRELSIASALILGYKDNIDPLLKNAYSNAGVMHILAVSGLHVGLIFLIFNQLLKFLEKRKYGNILKGVTLVFILWVYALLTGLSPSVMRAATMFSFIVLAKMLNRNSNTFNTLAASAFVLLLFNPLLIMEVGFQLSYLAVLGILIIQPWVYNWVTINWWLGDKLWSLTAVSIAAQIATFPLALLYFHQFPNYFIFSNLIVIPLATLILYWGLATLLFSFVPFLSDYLAWILNKLIAFLNFIVSFIEQLPYSISENIHFTITDTLLIYGSIASLVGLVVYRKFAYLLTSSILIILFLSSIFLFQLKVTNQKEFIVYNIPKHSAIEFIDGTNNVLFCDDELVNDRDKLVFSVQNNWTNKGINNGSVTTLIQKESPLPNNLFSKSGFIQFHNLKIVVIDKLFKLTTHQQKINIDYLILTDSNPYRLSELSEVFLPTKIIIDSSNPSYLSKRIKAEASQLEIDCWSVKEDGAFIVVL